MRLSVIGALLAFFNVALSAAGSHAFAMNEVQKGWFDLASQYIYIHSIVIIFSGFLGRYFSSRILLASAVFFLAGILFFSGSLYLLAIYSFRLFPMSTPLGGLSFMAGWALLATGLWVNRTKVNVKP